MTTPEEDMKKALDDFRINWGQLVDAAQVAFTRTIQDANDAMKRVIQQVEDLQVSRIVAENPGIDPEEVRASVRRTRQGQDRSG